MNDLVSALDRVMNAAQAEAVLRKLVVTERARGQTGGPMQRAHDAQVRECFDAAMELLRAEHPG